MHSLIRTIILCLVAFTIGRAVPPDAILVPLLSLLAMGASLLDFMLYLGSGRGLFHHLTRSK